MEVPVSLVLLIMLVLLLAFGVPVAMSLGLTGLFYMFQRPEFTLLTIPQKMMTGIDSFPLLAIVFFLLAGNLMNYGGATQKLVNFATVLVGHITGGLAHVTIVANVIMAGMSGSAAADAAATGTILIPAMVKSGYSRGFAASVAAAASTIGPIIPPSIPFVILGSMTGVSIGRLFLAGFIPGLLMGLYLMAAAYVISKRRGYAADVRRATRRELAVATWEALPALAMPAIVIGGILSGMFTPTEAAAVAAVYSLLLGAVYRGLKLRDLPKVLNEVVMSNAAIMLIVAIFSLIGWILAIEEIPQMLSSSFLSLTTNPAIFLLIVNILLFVLGIPVEPLPLMILLAPMLIPMLSTYGIDPVQFGVVFTLNTMIGLITPPVGMSMFIACHLSKATTAEFTREVIPFVIALVLVLLLITYVPAVTLWLPNLVFGPSG
jgi:C4-dicarboxylate transporter DctM subunit